MADGSIIPNTNSNCVISPGTTPAMTGPLTYVGAFRSLGQLANSHYDVSFQSRDSGASFRTQIEVFQTPPDDANPNIFRFDYAITSSTGGNIQIGDSSLYLKWVHWAVSVSSTQNAIFYAILEGFNPASPSYLVHSSSTAVRSNADTCRFCIEASDNTTVATSTQQGHLIISEFEASESEILAQFQQRAPTSAFSGHDHLYLPCNNSAAPNDDQGNPGTDWTLTGTFAGAANQPSEWSGVQPFSTVASQRVNRNMLLRL